MVIVTLVFGITFGTTSIGNQPALYSQVTADQIGTAAGLLRSLVISGLSPPPR
jgi:hypothetical protein